ncbi:hypothetical protein [Komagataeibacter swingsii]|uniref:Uncharacterized protein n=1 Tax=Komagataeibacter swingsii TaxID=215220 RepID=A0A2V4RK28_9PROT|nr:hypothetical protein [Komagataeibacter swingsii]PYD69354.1 hypothetical protein CFR76_09670 [Komagataeibacter swingsii]
MTDIPRRSMIGGLGLPGARTMTGRRNRTVHAIDPDRLRDLVLRANAPFAHADLGADPGQENVLVIM